MSQHLWCIRKTLSLGQKLFGDPTAGSAIGNHRNSLSPKLPGHAHRTGSDGQVYHRPLHLQDHSQIREQQPWQNRMWCSLCHPTTSVWRWMNLGYASLTWSPQLDKTEPTAKPTSYIVYRQKAKADSTMVRWSAPTSTT